MERYIKYLKIKRKINTLIDSLSATLENKYIDMINMYNIKNAQEVHNNEIDLLKQRLDKFEAYYAKLKLVFIVVRKNVLLQKNNMQ